MKKSPSEKDGENRTSSRKQEDSNVESPRDNEEENVLHHGVSMNNSEDDDDEREGCWAKMTEGKGCCGRCCLRFPRCCACMIGVLFPLFGLMLLSLFFGYFLAELEAPTEVSSNDNIVANETEMRALMRLSTNFTAILPWLCYELFLAERPPTDLEEAWREIVPPDNEIILTPPYVNFSDDLLDVNSTALAEFMILCGIASRAIKNRLDERAQHASSSITGGLTFNWIRCLPEENIVKALNFSGMQQKAQAQYFTNVWNEDQQTLYNESYQEHLALNYTPVEARIKAFELSVAEATGGTGCKENVAAAAWFW